MARKMSDKSPVEDSAKETPQPRSDNDPRQPDVRPNPERDAAGDRAEIETVERTHTPGS